MRLKALLSLALVIAAPAVQAQTVSGKIVTDSGGMPIAGVIIALINAKGDTVETTRSDPQGSFILRTKDAGTYTIRATRLSFAPVTTNAFPLNLRTIVQVKLELTRQTVLLSPMVVVGSRMMNFADMMSTEGMEWRRLRYPGTFIDTSTIRQAGNPGFSILLKNAVPGLQIVPGPTGHDEIRMIAAGGECTPDLYRDGGLQNMGLIPHLNGTNSAEFYGIEVYRRPNIPLEFRRTGFDCAVIALWTKWSNRGRGAGG